MKGWMMIATLLISILVVATTPAVAQSFDNSGGGSWQEYYNFPLTTSPTVSALYIISINGTTWTVYNASKGVEISGTNTNFWSLVNSSGADIRVFNQTADQNGQLYFYIESWDYANQTATIWVNVTPGSTEINIAYGNPNAIPSNYNNASMVFDIYDDFDDGVLDTSKWITNAIYGTGTWNIYESNGYLVIDISTLTLSVAIQSTKTLSLPFVVEGSWYGNIVNIGEMWTFISADSISDGSLSELVRFGYNRIPDFYYQEQPPGGTLTTIETFSRSAPTTDTPFKVIWDVNSKYFESGVQVNTIESQSVYASGSNVYIGFSAYTSYSSPLTVYVNWVRAYRLSDPVDFITPVIKTFQKQFGTKTVYINVTYLDTLVTSRHNPIAYYSLADVPQISVTSSLSITGVNASVGANISIELINFVTLDSVIYNGTNVTANLTYQGIITNTTTGLTYNVYNFTTYENGTLEIYGYVDNVAYNTTFKLDGEVVDIFNTTAIIGELVEIALPHIGNVYVGNYSYTNATTVVVNTKDIGTGSATLVISIEDPENFTVGYKSGTINITYGRLNIAVKHKDLTPFTEAQVSVFNENYSILSVDSNKLYAGVNRIDIFFHGIKLKSVSFYLNHSTTGSTISIDTNSIKLSDYRGTSRIIASPNAFDVVNLSPNYPYSHMEIRNYSGTVVIDYTVKPPTSIEVVGADFVEYSIPVLKFSGSGNATITDLYKLSIAIKDRLGNPLNFYIIINDTKVDASNGVVVKLLKPSWYEISVPFVVNGFELWSFANSSDRVLIEVNASDVTLPPAEYRVPTKFETKEVRITSSPWIPIPFLSPKQDGNVTVVRFEGSLKDYYNAPVIGKTIKIEISSKNLTRIFNVTTDESGNFRIEVDMAKGIQYTVTYKFEGDDVYVGSSTQKTFLVEQLLPAPIAEGISPLIILLISATGISIVAAAIYLSRKGAAVTRAKIEREFRYFRKLR